MADKPAAQERESRAGRGAVQARMEGLVGHGVQRKGVVSAREEVGGVWGRREDMVGDERGLIVSSFTHIY